MIERASLIAPQSLIGTGGEHLVCADLIRKGHVAFMSMAGLHYDVLAEIYGETYKVAVKTTLMARPRSGRKDSRPCYQFCVYRRGSLKEKYDPSIVDFIALAALDSGEVAYIRCVDAPCLIHLEDSRIKPLYRNKKGPKPGKIRSFADFPLEDALRCVDD